MNMFNFYMLKAPQAWFYFTKPQIYIFATLSETNI